MMDEPEILVLDHHLGQGNPAEPGPGPHPDTRQVTVATSPSLKVVTLKVKVQVLHLAQPPGGGARVVAP